MEAKAGIPDASHLYEVEYRAQHAARPGFRIQELRLSKTQKVPWHYHNNVQDTFYVLQGSIHVYMREPKEDVVLKVGDCYTLQPKRPHLVDSFTRKTFAAMIEGIREPAIKAGMMSPQDFDAGIRALYRSAEDDVVFCYTFFKAVGKRGQDPLARKGS